MSNNHVEIWNKCLAVIKDNVTPQGYKTWFEPIVPVSLADNVLTLQVPTQFFYEYLEELQFLAETAGAVGDKKFVQRVDRPDKATYIRSGKLKEIAEYCEENHIDYVIFDDEII